MVKRDSTAEMIGYLGQLVDGHSGIDGRELSRETSSAFEELMNFPEVAAARLLLPSIETFNSAVFNRAPVDHRAYVQPQHNPDRVAKTSRVVSPFNNQSTSHPLAAVAYGNPLYTDPPGFIFVVSPAESDLNYSIVVARENLRRPGAYMINLVLAAEQ